MKYLNRPEAPNTLSQFRHGLNNWNEYITLNKDDIWEKINSMQGGFCAYCECTLRDKHKHVEHFRTRNQHVALTFSWANIFGSCNSNSRCGKHKDNPKNQLSYDPSDIIKPDKDNPSEFLIFLTNGKVRPRFNLDPVKEKKATETIRVLNLNHDTALRNSRRSALAAELQLITEVYELQNDCSQEDWEDLLDSSINDVVGREFQTALEHAWKYNTAY